MADLKKMCWLWGKIHRCVAIGCLCAALCAHTTGYAHGPSAGCIWHTSTLLCTYIATARCSPWELWAGVLITLLLLQASSPLCWKKSFVLLLASKTNRGKSAILAGIQQLWSGNPAMSSEFAPAGSRVPSRCFDTGPVQFWEEELICGVLQQGRSGYAVYHTQFHLPSGIRERMLGFYSLFTGSSAFPTKVQKSSRVCYWSNAHEFTMKLTAFTFF